MERVKTILAGLPGVEKVVFREQPDRFAVTHDSGKVDRDILTKRIYDAVVAKKPRRLLGRVRKK